MAFISHVSVPLAQNYGTKLPFVQPSRFAISNPAGISSRRRRARLVHMSAPDSSDQSSTTPTEIPSTTSENNGTPSEDAYLSDSTLPSIEDIEDDLCSVDNQARTALTSDMAMYTAAKDSVDTAASETGPSDAVRIGAVGIIIAIIAALLQHSWVYEHRDLTMIGIFVLGYVGIIFENTLAFDKTGVALLMGVGIWTVLMTDAVNDNAALTIQHLLSEKMAETSEILFFLVGAMTIVEIIDAHRGFKVVTDFITTNKRKSLLWTVGILTFFVSAVLDNLTSTIVIVSLLRKLVSDPEERWLYGAVVVVAANAGGAWTPIGDVTTTQLWVHGNITALKTMTDLFLPSLVSLITSLAILTPTVGEGDFKRPDTGSNELAPRAKPIFWAGLASLISVPIFKAVTGLPPYLGMLSGLGTLWVMTDVLHAGENRDSLRGLAAIKKIDTSSVLFFLGILLAVGGLESAGILQTLAQFLDAHVPSREIIATAIGLLSAIVDNVPLVAATMGMYSLDQVPIDSDLWQLIAFCAGTGGSILIIGSAAGVAFMYVRNIRFLCSFLLPPYILAATNSLLLLLS